MFCGVNSRGEVITVIFSDISEIMHSSRMILIMFFQDLEDLAIFGLNHFRKHLFQKVFFKRKGVWFIFYFSFTEKLKHNCAFMKMSLIYFKERQIFPQKKFWMSRLITSINFPNWSLRKLKVNFLFFITFKL